MMNDGSEALEGKETIHEAMKGVFARPGYSLTWRAEGVEIAPGRGMGYCWGKWFPDKNDVGDVAVGSGYYLTVWKREPGGAWKVVADMNNRLD